MSKQPTKPCEVCQSAIEREHRMHCPTCIYCGARLIQNIQKLNRPREERSARCKAVLQDWMGYGHDEAELRRLAKGPKPIDPQALPKVNK